MTSEFSVADLVPHSGDMSLLDSIVAYGDGWLHAEVTIRENSMFVENGVVPAWIGLEYLAQTIGAYSGLEERLQGNKPKLGFLLGTRKYSCTKDCFELGQTLQLKVEREMQGDNGLSAFRCVLSGDNVEAIANLNVFQPDDAEKFLREAV